MNSIMRCRHYSVREVRTKDGGIKRVCKHCSLVIGRVEANK